MPRKKFRVMLDLETMGNRSTSAIIAIGAVRFSVALGIEDEFYKVIDLNSSMCSGCSVDADTIMWWMRQSHDARKQFRVGNTPLVDALKEFTSWINWNSEVWGNGSDFDNVILANAFHQCNLKQPWPFYHNRCYRTMKNMFPEIVMKRKGTYHNAVDDARSQADHLLRILAYMKGEDDA